MLEYCLLDSDRVSLEPQQYVAMTPDNTGM